MISLPKIRDKIQTKWVHPRRPQGIVRITWVGHISYFQWPAEASSPTWIGRAFYPASEKLHFSGNFHCCHADILPAKVMQHLAFQLPYISFAVYLDVLFVQSKGQQIYNFVKALISKVGHILFHFNFDSGSYWPYWEIITLTESQSTYRLHHTVSTVTHSFLYMHSYDLLWEIC